MKSTILAAALVFVPAASFAEIKCAPRFEMLAGLMKGYNESLTGRGIDADGRSVEILMSQETGTWSLLVTTQDRTTTCLVSSGQSWESVAPPPKGDPA